MANDLRFGIYFDLDKGIRDAIGEGDKALRRLENALAKHPINVKVKLDTGRTRGAQSEMVGFRKQLAELTREWNALTAAERGSAAGAALRQRFRALREEAQGYTSSLQAAVKQEEKLAQTQKKTGEGFMAHSSYLSRLVQRMVAYASVSYVGGFLTQVRQVTAEFELQRISLGAIIQDQQRANQLFSEIKTFALKSPVKILDLTKYTKQLAAYKIGVDELFETTKRLTDISVGLGVSMDRIVLMYGQIRATGYLRASEVRQATEAGIPLVEELANKLSKANGELVTAADVMDMISKRAISFDMVKEVFDDMTSAGGIFYNMQEKQGNTLYGMWQKLGDAAAVMYDEIGNTEAVNEGMKSAIQSLRYLMLHWRQVGTVVAGISVLIISNTVATKNNAIATAAATAANKQHVFSLNNKLNALRLEQANLKATSIFQRIHTAATISATKAQIAAANSTNIFSKALYSMKAALLSNPLTALAVALTTIIALLKQSERELDKLNSKLQDIERDYDIQGKKSVDRFKELVKAVEENVDGSKAQKEALDELDRTYGKILGSEALELGSLKALHGQYGELIDIINAYNAAKKGEEKVTATESSYSNILNEEAEDLKDFLYARGLSQEQTRQFVDRLNDLLIDGLDPKEATDKAFAEFADDLGTGYEMLNKVNLLNLKKFVASWKQTLTDIAGYGHLQFGRSWIYNYAIQFNNKQVRLDEIERETKEAADACGVYSSAITDLGKSLKSLDWSSQEALFNSMRDWNSKHPENMLSVPINLEFDPTKAQSEYEKMIEMGNMQIHAIFSNLQDIASKEGVAIPEEFYKQAKSVVEGNKTFSVIDFEEILKLFSNRKAQSAIEEAQRFYNGISPSNPTVAAFRNKLAQLATKSGVELSQMTQYFMSAGDNIKDYAKRIKEAIEDLEKKLEEMRTTNQMVAEGGHGPLQGFSEEDAKKIQMQVAVLKELFPFLQGFTKSSGSGRKSDPRLQNLKEEISLTKKLYDEYQKLEKQIGAAKAAEKIQQIYSNTIKTLQERAGKYGFKFKLPFTDENLKANMQHFIDKMKELQKLKDKKGNPLFPNIGKEIDEAVAQLEDVDFNSLQKQLEKKLKELADRISRTKTAKEFYEKILSQTGDIVLAANVSTAIYGDDGFELQKRLAEQIRGYFQNDIVSIEIPIDIIGKNNAINYKRLGEFAEQMKDKLGEEPYKAIKKIAEEGQKDMAKTWEGYFKDLEKAESYASKRIKLAQTTADKIANIRADMAANPELQGTGAKLISGLIEKEMKEAAQLEWEAFKDTPLYVQMFEDLEQASTSTLEMMKSRLEALSRTWGSALDPTQLKEMQSRMNEITGQLRERNPWKSLKDAYAQYKAATKSVTAEGAIENTGVAAKKFYDASATYGADSIQAKTAEQELKAREKIAAIVRQITLDQGKQVKGQKALTLAQQEAFDQAKIARGHLEIANAELIAAKQKAEDEGKDPATDPGVIAAQERVKAAEEEVNLTQKVSEILDETAKKSKTLKESLVGAAQNVTQFLQIGSDIAAGIATTMEALGADENDVQYFNDIAEAIGDITAGFQGLIDSALSLNVGGIISNAVGIIPNMVKGFAGLFSAGKIRKANKEIERQQELLDRLEYTYGRLEKAAEKAFGGDFINNFKAQQKNLEAQAQAYMRQAEAERSKGKDADEDKIKEYENAYRDTLDAIADMQGKIAEQMAGTDVESAARDFAQAWLEAYATFSNTTGAIKDKFNDMIKNMVVESVMGKVVQQSLQPMFDEMNEMYLRGESTTKVLSYAFRRSSELAEELNRGLLSAARDAEAAGVDLKGLYQTSDNMKGISRNTAGASEESINANTAALTTQNYYASHLPTISENVAAMRMLMEGGMTTNVAATPAGWTDWQQQAMDNYIAIQRNTADMVVECRSIAAKCQEQTELLKKVIVPKGVTPSYRIYTRSDI